MEPQEIEVQQDLIILDRKYYQYLMDKTAKLIMLEDHGVDNWEGYDEAMSAYRALLEPDPAQGDLVLAESIVLSAQEGDDV